MVPSVSRRETRRSSICVSMSRPCKSSVRPLELSDGIINVFSELSTGDHRYILFAGYR